MAHLEELRAEFSDHDTVLHLLLGLVSLSRRLERVLPEPSAEASGAPPAPLPEEEERRVLLLLGLVSVRRTVMGTLEPLRAASAPGQPEPVPGAGLPSPRELLR